MNDLLGEVKARTHIVGKPPTTQRIQAVAPPTEQLAKVQLAQPAPETEPKHRFTKYFRSKDAGTPSPKSPATHTPPALEPEQQPEEQEEPGVEYYMSDEEFMAQVTKVKAMIEDMNTKRRNVVALYSKIGDMTKTAEIQRAQASNDADVASIKRNAKASMAAIEMLQGEIDYSDIASSAERMRHTIVAGLSTRLKKELDALHGFEDKVNTEYREVVERRLRVVTGKDVEEEEVEAMIASGEAETIFRVAQQQQQRTDAVDMVFEQTNDRYNAMAKLTQDLRDIQQMMLDFATLVHEQGAMLDSIEANVATMADDVGRGTDELLAAKRHKKKKEKFKSAATGVAVGAAGAAAAAGAVATGIIAAPLAM